MQPTVEAIYLRAREMDEKQRHQYLSSACTDRPDIRDKVHQFLKNEQSAKSYFGSLKGQLGGLLDDLADAAPIPHEIGDYRPTALLGRGGMGTVYLATRCDGQFDREVAIKVLPAQFAGAETKRRFYQERQILARLDHPNICHLLDGGVSDNGLPYFVMDYVDGVAIDQFADQHKLSIEDRLRLFLQVCEAVAYAHRNLILHRDIKPANVLVDQQGRVRLLDFGVGKLLGDLATELAHQTTRLPITPRYASPEQIGSGPVTTASDVYALGMLLYTLLTGAHPHDLGDLTVSQCLRRLSEKEAPTASRRVRQLSKNDGVEGVTETAKLRRRSVNGFTAALAGDLDVILAKAMRLEPVDRYASVSELAADVQRHLDRQPIAARRASIPYVMSKFVRRHKMTVGLSAAVAALTVAIAVGGTWSAINFRDQARTIATERDRADATRNFLLSIFQAAHPNRAKGKVVSARELVDEGAQRAGSELQDQPELQAELLNVFADLYSLFGAYAEAESLWRDELDVRSRLSGDGNLKTANTMENLSRIVSARGGYDEAMALALRAVAIRQQHDDPIALANSEMRLGRLAHHASDYPQAESIYRRALSTFRSSPDQLDRQMHAATLLASVLRDQAKVAEALSILQDALNRHRASQGLDNVLGAHALDVLGSIQRKLGDYALAEAHYLESLDITRTLLGPEHRDVAFALSGLAKLAVETNQPEVAEQRYREAIKIFSAAQGDDHANVGIVQINLGQHLAASDACDRAAPLLQRGWKTVTKRLPTHGSISRAEATATSCQIPLGS